MSENTTLVLSIAFMAAFWAVAIWLFTSKAGNKVIRALIFVVATVCLVAALYIHWEPSVAMVCLPVGFAAGLLFAEWYYDIRGITALRSDLQHQRQLLEREERFQQAQRPWLDSESDELTYRNDPGALPPAGRMR